MISSELLEVVLGNDYKPRLFDWFEVEDNTLTSYYDCGKFDELGRPTGLGYEINIHELAHKCKEWANTKGYWVHSHGCWTLNGDKYIESGSAFISLNSDIPNELFRIKLDTEPEAIFKACQWILNNKQASND